MKRTRKDLVEFLSQNGLDPLKGELADKLIAYGWVKVEEPREFWLCMLCGQNDFIDFSKKMNRHPRAYGQEGTCCGIPLHVREVEDSNE